MMVAVQTLLFGGAHLAWGLYRRLHGLPWPGRWNSLAFMFALSISIVIAMQLANNVCRSWS